MKKILMGNRYIRRYYEDPIFNSRVILYRGLLINILYAFRYGNRCVYAHDFQNQSVRSDAGQRVMTIPGKKDFQKRCFWGLP